MGTTKPSEESFKLEKVKLLNNGGLNVHYEISEKVNGMTYTNHYVVDNDVDVHPDLRNLFAELVPMVARVFKITSLLTFIDGQKDIPTDLQYWAKEYADNLLEDIDVKGVAISRKGEIVGVILNAVYTADNNMKCALNTPRIKFSTLTFGFEQDLEAIVENIRREVYEYLFDGKQAQLSMFGAEEMTQM